MTSIAVLGLGEAGRLFAAGYSLAGARVRGYDPFVTAGESGVEESGTLPEALEDADIVISLVGPRAAVAVAREAGAVIGRSCVYADFNTLSPQEKREIAQEFDGRGLFADVAVMAPVPRAGSRTPLLASGTGAEAFVRAVTPLGTPATAVSGTPGDAAGRKLLRSVFMKGLAALIVESLEAAREAGAEEDIRGQIASELGEDGEALVDRLVRGTRQHAARRVHEMESAAGYLAELGARHPVTDATVEWLRHLSDAPAQAENKATPAEGLSG